MGKHKKSQDKIQRKSNKTPIIAMTGILVVLFIWIMSQLLGAGTPSSPDSPPVTAASENGVQIISMELSAAGYSPNNITVKKGVPVTIETNAAADAGCVRGLMIPDFNINKALDVGEDSFTFTPDKTGSFTFTCQMKMSNGTITVI